MSLEERDEEGNISKHHAVFNIFWKQNLLDNSEISEVIEFKTEMPNGYSTEVYSVRFMGADF
jgi:hypothetical protein